MARLRWLPRWGWRRWLLVGLGIAALLAGSGVIAYRVFAPHELLTQPSVPYPEEQVVTDDRPFSELRAAPLVVDGRLRVYAEQWRVWSDAPVGERYETTPYWAFRRWPAQVVGVVLAPAPTGDTVITQWSDGELVALDAKRGVIAWRDAAPLAEGRSYDGRRTGASVVYRPRSLFTVRTADRTVVVATGPTAVAGFDATTGEQLWRRELPGGCDPAAWTGAGMVVVPVCGTVELRFFDAATGADRGGWTSPNPAVAPSPALCELGRSECRLVTVRYKTWLLGADAKVTSVPELERGAQLAGERVIYQTGIGVAARRLTDETPLWRWDGQAKLIGANTTGVYLLTNGGTVLELSPATGHLVAIGCAWSRPDEKWVLGYVYPSGAGTYLALERLNDIARPGAEDQEYFYGPRPVALVELYSPTKVSVWPGKFEACADSGVPG
jgi:outer membrane protein assembly factor BamB